MCPLVTGSKDPGQAARRTHDGYSGLLGRSLQRHAAAVCVTVPKRGLAVAPRAVAREPRRPGQVRRRGVDALDDDHRLGAPATRGRPAPAGRSPRRRRSARRAGRGTPRRTAPAADCARARAAGDTTTSTPVMPSVSTLSRMSRAVRRSCSTSVTTPAPRERASSPTAPLPAYRSRKRSPCREPSAASTAENSASRTRSEVGRVRVAGRRLDAATAGLAADDPGHRLLQVVGLLGVVEPAHRLGQPGVPGERRVVGHQLRSPPRAPAAITSSWRSTCSSRRLERRPDWVAPSTSPSRRCSRSTPRELEPVVGGGDRVEPLACRRALRSRW